MKSNPRTPNGERPHGSHRRRGTIYIITLGSSLIVAVMGLAAMKSVSVQREQAENVAESFQAQLNARTGLDFAMLRIESNSDWRTQFANGTWTAQTTALDGTYQITVTDPVDGDLTDDPLDPVIVTSTGVMGDAVQKLQFQLEPAKFGIAALQGGLSAGNDLIFDAAMVTSDFRFTLNRDAIARNSAVVNADVEAAGVISTFTGGQFTGTTTTSGDWPRQMPDTSTVFDHYTTNGTTIDIDDIPDLDAGVLDNGQIVNTTGPWGNAGGTVSLGTDRFGAPDEALVMSDINSDTNHVYQDVTDTLRNGETYSASAWVTTEDVMDMRLMLDVVSTGDGAQTFVLTPWNEVEDDWKKITGSQAVSWTGTLTSAKFWLQISGEEGWLKLDEVDFSVDTGSGPTGKVIEGVVISPSSNPFPIPSGGPTNPDGIYVIDAEGQDLIIRNSRIEGTLIILNQGPGSEIEGSVHWEPAVYSTDASPQNLPALLTNADILIGLENAALDEATIGANFNPTGTPYGGVSDADMTDTYPSSIKGLIYSTGNITLETSPTIEGIVMAEGDVTVNGATLTHTYDSVYYEKNPPPGFEGDFSLNVKAGSFKKVVD